MAEPSMSEDRNIGSVSGRVHKPGTFQPGNPGKPRGARNKAALAVLALLEGEREALTRKAVELALGGDMVALKLCLERLLPKGRAVPIDLPMRTLADLDQATETIRETLAAGEVSLDEVGTLTALVEARRRLIETTELERRLVALEAGGRER
jgi:hypothetical protein